MKTDYLLHREVGHVLAALMPQNRLIARVCLHTGLRVGDVVSLRTQGIGLQMMVTEAKTKKRRRVGLTASLLAAIRAQAGPEWAFPGKRPGTHKTRQAVWADVKRAARAFRLPQNVAPHSLRKVYAVELLERYGDISASSAHSTTARSKPPLSTPWPTSSSTPSSSKPSAANGQLDQPPQAW